MNQIQEYRSVLLKELGMFGDILEEKSSGFTKELVVAEYSKMAGKVKSVSRLPLVFIVLMKGDLKLILKAL